VGLFYVVSWSVCSNLCLLSWVTDLTKHTCISPCSSLLDFSFLTWPRLGAYCWVMPGPYSHRIYIQHDPPSVLTRGSGHFLNGYPHHVVEGRNTSLKPQNGNAQRKNREKRLLPNMKTHPVPTYNKQRDLSFKKSTAD